MSEHGQAVAAVPGGTALRLRVVPRARHPGVDGTYGAAVRLRVAAPPTGGQANREVVALLASVLGVRRRDVEIVAGARGRDKTVRVRGLAPGEVAARLARGG